MVRIGMKKRHSTKMEEAWFVDPELLAREEGDQSTGGDIDEQKRNETLTLEDNDFEEAPELDSKGTDSGTIKYKEVALKGAIMAPEEAKPLSAVLKTKEKVRGLVPRDGSIGSKLKTFAGKASVVADIFEQGRIPPIWLAAIAFFAGVITTLIGVFIAL